MQPRVGQSFTFRRTFTVEDVKAFADVSGDRGIQHMQPDGKGRIMLQGLLTATLPTKIGGDLNYIARTMSLEFVRPVFAGDTVTVEAVVEAVTHCERGWKVGVRYVCRNQSNEEVLRGTTEGLIKETASAK
jgi:acyl dehydratase